MCFTPDLPEPGRIELIGGPMFSGKTTELLRRLICDASVKRRVLYINHTFDVRTVESYSTHNPLYKEQLGRLQTYDMSMVSCSNLPELTEVEEYDTIGIDECQFFDNLDRVREYADNGKRVIAAGLVGDTNRRIFGHLAELLPESEDYTSLSALCAKCAEVRRVTKASFTFRLIDSMNQVDVGGADKYLPVCRAHYLEPSTNSH